jgi:hypothetical protein
MAQGIFNLKQVNQAIRQGAWSAFNPPQVVEYLVVAGGGGGGSSNGGGGGAGGLLTGIVTVAAGASYTVTVGAGGNGGSYTANLAGFTGSNSIFSSITSTGGGGGGTEALSTTAASSGGSGGGANYLQSAGTIFGQGISGQGNAGGKATGGASPYNSGGGGGAGTVGLNAVSPVSGNGGAGIASAISGTVTVYAGGGGGGCFSGSGGLAGNGGVGGGGTGSTSGYTSNGTVNTGGGGGGSGNASISSGKGASGIVIVRYPGNVQFYTGGAVTYANGHVVHTFYITDTLAPTTPTVLATSEYQISRSLRFNSVDSPYLNRTPGSAGNRRTWTWSGWVKRTAFGANGTLLACGTSYSETGQMAITFSTGGGNDTDCLNLTTGDQVFRRSTNQLRDPSAWYHLVVAFDTTQSNASDRVKMYINAVQVTSFVLSNNPVQNTEYGINQAALHHIGGNTVTADTYLNGYLTDVHFIDGQQLTPSSFGEYDVNTGVWRPKAYTGTYGTNGYKLNFSDNSNTTAGTLGADSSGNGNNWTPNNFSVTAGIGNDSMVDTPTPYGTDTGLGGEVRGNYATWDALGTPSSEHGGNGFNLTNGNLTTGDGTDLYYNVYATIAPKSGKFYIEKTYTSADSWAGLGITRRHLGVGGSYATISSYFSPYLLGGGDFVNNTTSNATAWGYSISNTDTISMAIDYDNRAVWFAVNGVWIDGNGSQSSAIVLSQIIAGDITSAAFKWGPGIGANIDDIVIYSRDRDCIAHTNFGQRAYTYTAPTGFKALCTTNLSAPTIGSGSTSVASKFFNTVLWTGDGAQTRSITGVGFQPDFTWMKIRADTPQDHQLYDAVRGAGAGKNLSTNTTAIEGTVNGYTDSDYGYLSSFDSDGFSVNDGAVATTGGYVNYSARTYVAWNWKASNATAVTNTSGTITSSVRANLTSGFSVVRWTGSSSNNTVGHGLGVAPKFIITRSANEVQSWYCYHESLGRSAYIMLDNSNASAAYSNYWGSTAFTSSVFGVFAGGSGGNNRSGQTMISYCFAPIAGYSEMGSYIGNGSADGPVITTGFRPAFILIKRTDTGSSDWQIIDTKRDTYNSSGQLLQPNTTAAESDARPVLDILSNGFKHRNTYNVTNVSTATYIYMAFAETPFKYSLAR